MATRAWRQVCRGGDLPGYEAFHEKDRVAGIPGIAGGLRDADGQDGADDRRAFHALLVMPFRAGCACRGRAGTHQSTAAAAAVTGSRRHTGTLPPFPGDRVVSRRLALPGRSR